MGGGGLHLDIDVEEQLKGGGVKLGERGEVVGMLSNAELLDVPISLAQCSLSTSYLLNIYNNGYNEHIIVVSFIFQMNPTQMDSYSITRIQWSLSTKELRKNHKSLIPIVQASMKRFGNEKIIRFSIEMIKKFYLFSLS